MKIIDVFESGEVKTAKVTEQEFKELEFKRYDKAPKIITFLADIDYIKVTFNKKGQVCDYRAREKESNVPTNIFRKEAVTKSGNLKKSAIKILESVGC